MTIKSLSHEQLKVIHWAAQECEHQQSGERSVAWMLEAWDYAFIMAGTPFAVAKPTVYDILHLGMVVEPNKNANGWRRVSVRIGWNILDNYDLIPQQIVRLCEHGTSLTPTEWYEAFEEIHPFVDGNGRVGNILWNWLSGSLGAPEFPPDVFAVEKDDEVE